MSRSAPNNLYVSYVYDMLNRVTRIGEDGATSGVGLLASYTYDDHGRRTNVARAGGAGAATAIGYDGSDRISRLAQNFTGAAADVTWTPTYSYNPSPQAVGIGSTNDGYAWHGGVVTRNYVANGLNQYATVGPNAWTYDGRGNLMSNTTDSYTYDPQNRLLTASGPTPVTLTYDPIGHLQTTASGGATTTFLYAGDMLVGEYDASGNILRRYVPGPGVDEPVIWYEGAGTSDRRWLHADTSGSVVGYSDSSGNSGATYAYDPYGLPPSWSAGDSRYRYTGQLMIPEANLYSYKARMYDPANGRFLQTDPVGYQSDINLYAYVGNDPINGWDPSGMDVGGLDDYDLFNVEDDDDFAGTLVRGVTVNPPGTDAESVSASFSLTATVGAIKSWLGFAPTPRPARGASPQSNSCGSASLVLYDGGLSVGASADAGIPGVAGAGANGSAGVGGFYSGNAGFSAGAFASGGAAAYAGSHSASAVGGSSPAFLGASAGIGISGFITNAQSVQQLSGPFTTYSVNVGFGPIQGTISLSLGGGIYQLSISPPGSDVSAGASLSRLQTTTAATGGCK